MRFTHTHRHKLLNNKHPKNFIATLTIMNYYYTFIIINQLSTPTPTAAAVDRQRADGVL